MFGRKITFGRKAQSFAEVKTMMRQTPDHDGVARVFSKELWDDPECGAALREAGYQPDDRRNRLPTADDYIALFAAAKDRLNARVAEFNRENSVRFSYCNAAPFLVIDNTIYDGKDGAFLYAQLGLIGFDDWNVLMLAADARTFETCGLAGHPGRIESSSAAMAQRVSKWKARYEFALETWGATVVGGKSITRAAFEAEETALRTEIVDFVVSAKPKIAAELRRVQLLSRTD